MSNIRIYQDVPEGMKGFAVSGPHIEELDVAIARAKLQETSLTLLKKHHHPFDLQLLLTLAGESSPIKETKDPFHHGPSIERYFLGGHTAVHIRAQSEDSYRFGINLVSETPAGDSVIDAMDYMVTLPVKNVHSGAIGVLSMARYFADQESKGKIDLSQATTIDYVHRGLRTLMRETKNSKGDTWEWDTFLPGAAH